MQKNMIPMRGYVLLKLIKDASVTSKGIAVPDSAKEQPQRAEVIAIGSEEVIDGKFFKAEFEVGDIVLFGKWQGMELKVDNEDHRLLQFSQVYAKEKNGA